MTTKPDSEAQGAWNDKLGPRGSYLAFPDFHTAALWYALFGRPEDDLTKDLSKSFQDDQQPDSSDEETPAEEAESDTSEDEGQEDENESPSEASSDGEPNAEEPTEEGADSSPDPIDHPDGDPDPASDSDSDPDDGDASEEGDPDPNQAAPDPFEGFELTDPTEQPPELTGLWRETIDGVTYHCREFRSWFDFVMCAADDSTPRWAKLASRRFDTSGWAGTTTFKEALDMALRTGWPEGRKLLSDMMVAVAPTPKAYESLVFEVAGAFPCVPVYCAGDPACMMLDPGADLRTSKPIVRIDYSNNALSNVTPESMMLRGAAVLSLASALEHQGLSVELRIVGTSIGTNLKDKFRHMIVYKEAGQPLDLDRAAFALAHPAVFRRLVFSINEQHLDLEPTFGANYGSTCHTEPADPTSGKPGGAIFIPSTMGGETPDTARKAVEAAARQTLIQLEAANN